MTVLCCNQIEVLLAQADRGVESNLVHFPFVSYKGRQLFAMEY